MLASCSRKFCLDNACISAARTLGKWEMGEVSRAMGGLGVARPAAVGVSRADPSLYNAQYTIDTCILMQAENYYGIPASKSNFR